MEISVAAVISIDGKLTRHDDPDITKWASKEDHEHYVSLMKAHEVLVMGRGTYEVVRSGLKLDDRLRVVLTSHPHDAQAEAVPGKLEFLKATPGELVAQLEGRGYKNLLIVGGPQLISGFLAAKLVNYFYLTVEPYVFGSGTPLTQLDLPLAVNLQLQSSRQLNQRGSMLLTYTVPD